MRRSFTVSVACLLLVSSIAAADETPGLSKEKPADGLAVQKLDASSGFQRIEDKMLNAFDVARAPARAVIGGTTPLESVDDEVDARRC